MCKDGNDVAANASKMLGYNLITKQTTAEGLPCTKVMLVEKVDMKREMYISIMLDRGAGGPIFIASPAGGTSIEDVAEATPELIFKQPIDIMTGVTDENATFLATSLGFTPGTAVIFLLSSAPLNTDQSSPTLFMSKSNIFHNSGSCRVPGCGSKDLRPFHKERLYSCGSEPYGGDYRWPCDGLRREGQL